LDLQTGTYSFLSLLEVFLVFIYAIPTVFAQYWMHQTRICKHQKNGFGKKNPFQW